jgi:hemoglobin
MSAFLVSFMKPDLDSRENIKIFIELFYEKVLVDKLLAHIFTDVAGIDVNIHIPIIRTYWEKLLLGDDAYKRHTMNIHRDIHAKFPLTKVEFDRWLSLFIETAREHFAGEKTERAIQVASAIASNMDISLNRKNAPQ